MTRFGFGKFLSVVSVAVLASATAAYADTITFSASASNPPGGDGPVDATATITTGTNSLEVILKNKESGTSAAGQEISGIIITLSNSVTGYSQTSLPASDFTGSLIDVASDGSSTPDAGPIAHWGSSASGAVICLETAGSCADGGSPTDLIIGKGPYSPNPSITGRNPQIDRTGTFNLTILGITSATTVDGVTFEFGTGPDFHLPGTVVVTPEPSSLFLLGTGILGAGLLVRNRTKSARAKA